MKLYYFWKGAFDIEISLPAIFLYPLSSALTQRVQKIKQRKNNISTRCLCVSFLVPFLRGRWIKFKLLQIVELIKWRLFSVWNCVPSMVRHSRHWCFQCIRAHCLRAMEHTRSLKLLSPLICECYWRMRIKQESGRRRGGGRYLIKDPLFDNFIMDACSIIIDNMYDH